MSFFWFLCQSLAPVLFISSVSAWRLVLRIYMGEAMPAWLGNVALVLDLQAVELFLM